MREGLGEAMQGRAGERRKTGGLVCVVMERSLQEGSCLCIALLHGRPPPLSQIHMAPPIQRRQPSNTHSHHLLLSTYDNNHKSKPENTKRRGSSRLKIVCCALFSSPFSFLAPTLHPPLLHPSNSYSSSSSPASPSPAANSGSSVHTQIESHPRPPSW